MPQPNPLYGRLGVLLACADEALAETTLGPTCASFIAESPGDEPALDLDACCECGPPGDRRHGQLVAWWSRMYPSQRFPLEADDPTMECGVSFAVEVGFRVSRCAAPPREDGTVDPAALAASAEAQLEDAYTLLRALRCCAGEDVVLREVVPWVDGGCIGSTVRLTLAFDTPDAQPGEKE